MVDDGAMINVIDSEAHSRIAQRLSSLQPSNQTLHMADGSLIPSTGHGIGTFKWGPVHVETTFEVFPSGGSWQMLIGKPLLEQTCTVQEYESDTILLPAQDKHVCIENYKPPWTTSSSSVLSTFFSPGRTQDNFPLNLSGSPLPTDTVPLHDTSRLEEQTRTITTETDKSMSTDVHLHLLLGYAIAHSFANFDRTNHLEVAYMDGRGMKETGGQERLEVVF